MNDMNEVKAADDGRLRRAVEEMAAALKRHDVAAVLLVTDGRQGGCIEHLAASWNAISMDRHPEGLKLGLDFNADKELVLGSMRTLGLLAQMTRDSAERLSAMAEKAMGCFEELQMGIKQVATPEGILAVVSESGAEGRAPRCRKCGTEGEVNESRLCPACAE